MTEPQNPFQPGQFPPAAPPPQPGRQLPPAPNPVGRPLPGQPPAAPQGSGKRRNVLTSKPVIGVAALVVGLVVGSSAGGAGSTAATVAGSVPTVTVTAGTDPSEEPAQEPAEEPTEEATEEPSDEPTVPADTSYKYGQKVSFSYEDVEISVRVDAPKASANTFDKDNLEAKLTVCNKGSATIDEMSAQGLGLYAEDKSDGQYDLYGAYRTPEFPVYSYDSSKLKPGKCRTGWVSFQDGSKAIRIATEVSDQTYSWSKSGN